VRVVVHDYFGHAFPAQLARSLASRGHQVLHLHCSSFVTGKGRLTRGDDDPSGLEFAAVDLGEAFAKYDVLRRVSHERKTASSLGKLLCQFRPDAVLSIAPLVVQQELQRAARRVGAAFVFWQQDVMSMAARRVLGRRSRLVGAVAGRVVAELERRILRRSDAVVVISEDFLPLLRSWGGVTICYRKGLDESPADVEPEPRPRDPRLANVPGAMERLEEGQQRYGDRWAREELAHLIREVLEEVEDVGCWGVLAAQRAGHDHPAVPHILRAIAGAAGAWDELRQARELSRDPEATPGRPFSDYES